MRKLGQEKINNICMFLKKGENRNASIEFGLLKENLELEGNEIYIKFKGGVK